eukprot:6187225-Pleurochrysis_carterae.AAC.3
MAFPSFDESDADVSIGGGGMAAILSSAVTPRNVPHAHGLVERGREHQVVLRVELRAHDVVVVPGEHRDAAARLPVPDADRLVVGGRDNPRVLDVELDLVAAGDEERLHLVEADTAHRPVVLVEAVEQRAHAVVPKLHDAIVQAREHPRPLRMKGEALHAVRLGLKLGQHRAAGAQCLTGSSGDVRTRLAARRAAGAGWGLCKIQAPPRIF